MTPSTKKILARFDGDRRKAIGYCESMANAYPRLYTEYKTYAETLKNMPDFDEIQEEV